MVCNRVGDKTRDLDLEERRERVRSAGSSPAFLAGVAFELPGIFTFWGPPHFPHGHINLHSCQYKVLFSLQSCLFAFFFF